MQPGGLERAVTDYFMVLRGPTSPALSEPARRIEELLEPYDAALLLSANQWRDRPELLSRKDYALLPVVNRKVNHFQFIADSGSDPHSIWGVEIKLREPTKGYNLWIPTVTTFVRMNSSMAESLQSEWISSNEFLHPFDRTSSSYNLRRLNGGISFVATITADKAGRIRDLTAIAQEEAARTILEVSFTRRGDPAFVPLTQAPIALQATRVILGDLPFDTIAYRGKPLE